MNTLKIGIEAAEHGFLPDAVIRLAIRRLCRQRLRELDKNRNNSMSSKRNFLDSMRTGTVAPMPEKANEQHYELPPEFFAIVLGPNQKYSCCFFDTETSTLSQAEESALAITCQHAELADGQDILELGCGWGSLSLWMAEHYPNSRITAVSNSRAQRLFIERKAESLGLNNLHVITADMNDYRSEQEAFDRVVSVEMFEHMRNYDELLSRISTWLRSDGKLFVHIFCHKEYCYPFETKGTENWMGQHFFTGGIMPSEDLLGQFGAMEIVRQHRWNGRHYQRTAEAWLANLDASRQEVLEILSSLYSEAEAQRNFHRWRIFFLAVAELFGLKDGNEWYVTHALMKKTPIPMSGSTNVSVDHHTPIKSSPALDSDVRDMGARNPMARCEHH